MTQFTSLYCRLNMMANVKIKNDKNKNNVAILITKKTIKDLSL